MREDSAIELTTAERRRIIKYGLDTKRAAEYIGVTPKTLANYRSLEQGPMYWKTAKGILYDPKDLDDYLVKTMKQVRTTYWATVGISSRCWGSLDERDSLRPQMIPGQGA